MILNPNVNIDTETSAYATKFYPDDGYALWQDNEEGNLDENGNPYQYYLQINVVNARAEATAPHIWAKLIDETMEVFGKIPGMEEVAPFGLRNAEPSHTYIDENGVEQRKKGVF